MRIAEHTPDALVLVSDRSWGGVVTGVVGTLGCIGLGGWLLAGGFYAIGLIALGSGLLVFPWVAKVGGTKTTYRFDAAAGHLYRREALRSGGEWDDALPLHRIEGVRVVMGPKRHTAPPQHKIVVRFDDGHAFFLTTTENPYDGLAMVARQWLGERGYLASVVEGSEVPPRAPSTSSRATL